MQTFLFVLYLIFTIAVLHLWGHFAYWFVRTEGHVAGLVLLCAILAAAPFISPYLDPPS